MFYSDIVVFMYYQDTNGMTAKVVNMESVDMKGNKVLFYMGNREEVDEVYYCMGLVLDNTVQCNNMEEKYSANKGDKGKLRYMFCKEFMYSMVPVYNLAKKDEVIYYEVSEAKGLYRIRKEEQVM